MSERIEHLLEQQNELLTQQNSLLNDMIEKMGITNRLIGILICHRAADLGARSKENQELVGKITGEW